MSEPREYDLSKQDERQRLLRELLGYMKVSQHERDGTDLEGRAYVIKGLEEAIKGLGPTDTGYAMEEKLHQITIWCNAYPLDIFPEPDLKKAAKVLKENGMCLDAISASNMRHVLNGIKEIIDANS